MGAWEPKVVVIEKVDHHPNGDNLDIVYVLGDNPVIVKRDEYKVGDLSGFVMIDSIVPDTAQWYFLVPKVYEKYEEDGEIKQRQAGLKYSIGSVPEKYRIIKAKRIRNAYSAGCLVPVPIVNGQSLALGDSIVEILDLKKWEEQDEDNIINAKKSKGANAASPPKGWSIPYYDVDSIRKYLSCLSEDEEVVLTEKLDGCNASFCFDGEKLYVKSRNFYKKMDSDDPWWDIAIRYNLEEKLSKFPMKVLFGELYGQVKGFRYDCELINGTMPSKIRFFDVYDPLENKYIDYDDALQIIKSLDLDPVPELYRGKWLGKEKMYPYAEGMTTLGGKHLREGCVIKPIKERFEPKLQSRMLVKLVGTEYTLNK